ncbi:hypothetical protein C8F04DRAFT_1120910 [Mycena alexandri]|uniref:Uncharacterized protein n=1 Tax=Mycena alexandri TaxID=1745969 RepID=A0AAD6SJ92_9AGAR|nr:hypothetical protein C8F04DRAFT_1120910 [Mycena alexandri]
MFRIVTTIHLPLASLAGLNIHTVISFSSDTDRPWARSAVMRTHTQSRRCACGTPFLFPSFLILMQRPRPQERQQPPRA